jgi:deazaflavin-dependent oxidoreductase (nitroreductase family)
MSSWVKIFTSINAFLYQKTNGHLGNQLGKQSILLLHTTGRKSGQTFTTPLSYYRDGRRYLVVASNWGKADQPNWYKNLRQQPRAAIQVGSATIRVEAQPAEGTEYNRLWDLVTRQNEQYPKYQKDLERQIPIVILTPTTP